MDKRSIQKVLDDMFYNYDTDILLKGEEELNNRYASLLKLFEYAYNHKDYNKMFEVTSYLRKIEKLKDRGYFTIINGNIIQFDKELTSCVKAINSFCKEESITPWRLRELIRP